MCRHVFDAIAVHANGDIVCWDTDIHGKRVYGNVFEDSIAQVFHGEGYNQIRDWFLNSAPDSWCPAIDAHCPLRSLSLTDGQHAPDNASERRAILEKDNAQVDPTTLSGKIDTSG